MMGLSEIIRKAHGDRNSVALGIDSEAVITALSATPSGIDDDQSTLMLSKMLSSPWTEVGTGRRGTLNSLESILPSCYNVQAPPPANTRLSVFTEETLFYMFYGMPRDRMQEMAARELTVNRGWRFYRELKLWILPNSATPAASSMTAGISALRMSPSPASSKTGSPQEEKIPESPTTASYVVFDANTWSKVRRELPILQEDQLEDRFSAHALLTPKTSTAA